MRVFKTKPFARFAEASGLEDDALLEVLQQMQTGLIHADLGGHVFKQRIARPGAESQPGIAF